jgi:hypothetical protein
MPPPGGPPPGPPPSPGGGNKAPLIIGIAAVLLLLLGGLAFFLLRDGEEAADDTTTTDEEQTTTTEEEQTTTTDGEETTTTEGNGGEIEFQQITDDTEVLAVEVPVEWTDIDGRPIDDPERGFSGPNVQASTDLTSFRTGFDVPGVSYTRLAFQSDPNATLDFLITETGFDQACTDAGRDDYDDGAFVGSIQEYEDCSGIGTNVTLVVASPTNSQEFSVEINFQLTANDPPEIGTRILSTFVAV